MPLTVDDVEEILTGAIIAAKLAPPDVAPGLAKTLAASITSPLNEIASPATGPVLTSAIPVSVMSVTEALRVRDAVAEVIDEAVGANNIAEGLLAVDYIDVPKVLALTRQPRPEPIVKSEPVIVQPITGSGRRVSPPTGSVPAS